MSDGKNTIGGPCKKCGFPMMTHGGGTCPVSTNVLAPMAPAAAPPTEGPTYGVIDPDYARVFTMARCLAWAEGYALMMHGSFTRDLDLLAAPWTEAACDPEKLVARISDATGLKPTGHPPGIKPHGRLAWTLLFPAFADPRFVDLSVMPRATTSQGTPA